MKDKIAVIVRNIIITIIFIIVITAGGFVGRILGSISTHILETQ